MRIVGSKWTGCIPWHLKDGPKRFNDVARMAGDARKKMNTERLRQLESQGLVRREVVNTSPVSVHCEITPFGGTALAFLDALRPWSDGRPREMYDHRCRQAAGVMLAVI